MADEARLKIILEDEGGTTPPPAAQAPADLPRAEGGPPRAETLGGPGQSGGEFTSAGATFPRTPPASEAQQAHADLLRQLAELHRPREAQPGDEPAAAAAGLPDAPEPGPAPAADSLKQLLDAERDRLLAQQAARAGGGELRPNALLDEAFGVGLPATEAQATARQAPAAGADAASAAPDRDSVLEKARLLLESEKERLAVQQALAELREAEFVGPPAPPESLDDKARRLLEAERERVALQERLNELRRADPSVPIDVEAVKDTRTEAEKLLDAEKGRLRVQQELAALKLADPTFPVEALPAPEEFSPRAEARKQVEASQRAAAVERERLEIDPEFAAKKEQDESRRNISQLGDLAMLLGDGGGRAGGIVRSIGGLSEATAAGAGGLGMAMPILAMADQVAAAVADTFNAASRGVQNLGNAAEQLAQNNNLEYLASASDAAAEMIGKLPVVGQQLEAQFKFLTTTVRAFDEVANAYVKRGQELAGFSGELTAAGAQADVRTLMADIREAQELGPDLARLTDAQNRASTEFRELVLPIKRFVVEKLADLLEAVAGTMQSIREKMEEMKPTIEGAVEGGARGAAGALAGGPIGNALADIAKAAIEQLAMAKAKAAEDKLPWVWQQLDDLENQVNALFPVDPDPVAGAAAAPLNVPMFG